uniref:Uncharacterized protein LOC104246491 n=1 Tax=Nicotiana sylvestris TaxID=4096 RepID=A0A1U7YF71_NICSY|nr:PREDICTED: uncharacterized protein LOC104246491 [Nicotiana sylvestris]
MNSNEEALKDLDLYIYDKQGKSNMEFGRRPQFRRLCSRQRLLIEHFQSLETFEWVAFRVDARVLSNTLVLGWIVSLWDFSYVSNNFLYVKCFRCCFQTY